MAGKFKIDEDTIKIAIWVIVGSMVLIQVGAYLLNQIFGVGGNVRLGAGFLLVILVGVIILSLSLVLKKENSSIQDNKMSIFFILLTLAILIFLMLNIKSLVPEIFTQAVFDLKSMIGII